MISEAEGKRRSQRYAEEIDQYETCLERLRNLWHENGPGPFSDLLNDCLTDVEALAETAQVFDVRVRLLAILQLVLGAENDPGNHRKVTRLMATMNAMPGLKWKYCRELAG